MPLCGRCASAVRVISGVTGPDNGGLGTARAAIKCPRVPNEDCGLRASKSIRHEPVKAYVLFGSFADKAAVDLCRDTHHEPA